MIVKGKNIGKKSFQSSLEHHSRSREWLMVNCVVNVTKKLPIRFLDLQRWVDQGWVHHTMQGMYMYGNAKQSKAWMTSFLFKEFLSIFKKSVPSENFQSKTSPNSKWTWITCYIRSNCRSTWIWFKYGHPTSSHISCSKTLRCKLLQAIQNYLQEKEKTMQWSRIITVSYITTH